MSKRSKKSKKSRPMSTIAIVAILVISNAATLFYFMYLDDSVPAEDVPMGIADVAAASEDYIGKTVTLIGYLVNAAGNYLIVSNPLFFFNNSLSVGNSVVLKGTLPTALTESVGKQIAVTGRLEAPETDEGSMGSVFDSFFDIETEITYPGVYVDEQLTPYPQFELIPHYFDPTAERYAVLYSGGIEPGRDHYRYWNDIIYMYFILQMHGYQSQNIYVIYKDGVSEDGYTTVDYPATHASLDTVFTELSDEMGTRDTLFFYTTNHGGSGGISVWNPMDSGGALTHSEVSDWLDSITCRNMIIVMEQCVSGKFINHISAQNRVVMTACKDDESSYACDDEGNWDEFVYHFMCALVSIPWNGDDVTVDADFNNNGYISMREAFIWAAIKDSRSETPWYNDNGDGVGYAVLEVVFLGAQWTGNDVYLGDYPPAP